MWEYIGVAFLLIVFALYLISDKVPSVNLDGAHVVVTGGSSGIGLSLAIELAKKGSHVTILARGKDKLIEAQKLVEKVRKRQNQNITQFSVDVSDYKAVDEAITQSARINNDRIDILICSAGITNVTRFMETDIEKISHVTNINYHGCMYCTRSVIPFMKKQNHGRIIYVASVLGLMGFPGYACYSPTKFAIRGLAESLQNEFAPWNIYFSVSCPANVDTPMFEEEEKLKPPETKKLEQGKIPSKPDAVACDIIKSLSSWRFLIPSDLDSFLVSIVSAGFGPASFSELLLQFFGSPFLRIAAMTEMKKYRQTVKDHLKPLKKID
jgi:3-dehydrosphinganine reductase